MRSLPAILLLAATTQVFAAQPQIDKARQRLNAAVAMGTIGSAVGLIADRDSVLLLHATGELGPATPMTPDAIVRLASITKPITAVAILMMEERGMLSLSDSVTRWFPGFGERVIVGTDMVTARRKVTVYDLLTHQSGVATDGPEYFKLFDAASAQEFSRGLGALPLRFHPGERWEYGCCGSAYEVLGAIVEQVSGTSLKEFLTTQIFLPLQMHDTYFSVPPEKRSRLAAQYRRDSTGALTPARQRGQEEPENSFYSGAGGLRSTVHDFHRFIQFLIGRGMLDGVRLLRAETVDRMITSQVAAGNSGGFGWGFGVAVGLEGQSSGPLSPGVFGWCGGTGTQFAADPRTGRIAIIIVPTSPGTPGVSALRNVFIQDALALPSSR